MNASILGSAPAAGRAGSPGALAIAWRRLRADRVAMVSLAVVVGYLLLMAAAALGLVAGDWGREVAVSHAPPAWLCCATPEAAAPPAGSPQAAAPAGAAPLDLRDVDPLARVYPQWDRRAAELRQTATALRTSLPMGADQWGRDVLAKAVKGTEVSLSVGLAAALLATAIGTLLGACAGFFGGWTDDALEWLYSVFTAIPGILLILAFAAVLRPGLANIVLILGLTGWTGIYRLVRAEYLRHRSRDYVRAADAIGVGRSARMFRHILPNVSHVSLVQLSQQVVSCIKAEVILSFLGFGVPLDQVSWGTMLAESQSELIAGQWWQLAAASVSMAVLVTAFSLLTDALRDALDPRWHASGS